MGRVRSGVVEQGLSGAHSLRPARLFLCPAGRRGTALAQPGTRSPQRRAARPWCRRLVPRAKKSERSHARACCWVGALQVHDISLTDYISVKKSILVPHTAGRYAVRRFRRRRCPIIERYGALPRPFSALRPRAARVQEPECKSHLLHLTGQGLPLPVQHLPGLRRNSEALQLLPGIGLPRECSALGECWSFGATGAGLVPAPSALRCLAPFGFVGARARCCHRPLSEGLLLCCARDMRSLTNSMMMHGRNNGKKIMAVRIVKHAMEIIHLLTDQNPIQVVVEAIQNRYCLLGASASLVHPSVSTLVRIHTGWKLLQPVPFPWSCSWQWAPRRCHQNWLGRSGQAPGSRHLAARRVNQAIALLTTGAREASFRNVKTIAECLADELMNAAKGSSNR